ncbi:MAG: calcium-binding protein, partial [Selenomonadaceae bacterium]|nr:calcium-binding protein [Selenomonadaceae bacterium]
ENGAASYPSGDSFTMRGLKVKIPKKNTLTTDQQIVVQGLYSWWIEEALKLVEESYGLSFTEAGTTVKEITLKFENEPYSTTLASVTPHFYVFGGKTIKLDLTINMGRFNNLSSSDVNGKSYDTSLYLDRTLAHEFTHAVMAANINYFSYLHDFIKEGAAELIHGVDDEREYFINYFAKNPDELAEYLRLDVNVMGDTGEYAAGYMFFRYLAKQGSLNPPTNTSITDSGDDTVDSGDNAGNNTVDSGMSNTSVKSGTSGKDSFYNFDSNVEIKMYAGDDYISNYGTNVTIDGGDGDDYIDNGGDNVTINGGSGNDTIYLTSYSGKDNLIQYSAGDGNDIIYNYSSTDTIQISGNSYTTTTSGNDVIINVGTGKITVKGGANQNIKINGSETYVTPTVPSGVTPINITNNNDNTIISGTSGDDTIENNNNYVTINGGAGNDSIRNYYNENATISGDAGNDIIDNNCNNASISGGVGDDSIYNSGDKIIMNGDDGSDYIYNWLGSNITISGGTGNDSIYNYYGTNNASLSGGDGNDSINNYINNNVTINGGAGDDTITLSGFNNSNVIQYANGDGNDIIYNYSSTDTIQISGNSYTTTTNGDDVIINIGDGSIKLKNAYAQTLNIITVSGGNNTSIDTTSGGSSTDTNSGGISTDTETHTETTTTTLPSGLKYNSSKTILTISKKYTSEEVDLADYASTVKTVKATSVNKEFTIYGNELDNKITVGKKATTVYGDDGNDNITGGKGNDVLYGEDGNDKLKGGSGADTLVGGAGKNTLTGGAGKDVFVHEDDGSDIITDYKAGQDSIMIEDEIDSVTVKGKNVIFNIGDSAVTVKGGKSKNITIIDSEGEIISNNKYTKSTKTANFVEETNVDSNYWFATEDNFATTDMDSIIEVDNNDYSVGKQELIIRNCELGMRNLTFATTSQDSIQYS